MTPKQVLTLEALRHVLEQPPRADALLSALLSWLAEEWLVGMTNFNGSPQPFSQVLP